MKETSDGEQYAVEVVLDDRDSSEVEGSAGQEREGVHLSGALSEVALPSLLGFFELERASGVLRLEQEAMTAEVFVKDGTILDVESEPAGSSPREVMADLFQWPDGTFEFSFQPVERDDAIGMSTTALLMECARVSDEEGQFG